MNFVSLPWIGARMLIVRTSRIAMMTTSCMGSVMLCSARKKPTASTQPITGSWMSEAYSPWNTRLLSVAAIARASVSNSSVNRRVLPMARICLMPIIASVNFAA